MDLMDSAGQTIIRSYGKFLNNLTKHTDDVIKTLSPPLTCLQDPIKFRVEPQEVPFTRLLPSNKVLLVFSVLCKEVELLTQDAQRKYFHFVIYAPTDSEDESDDALVFRASKLLPVLSDLVVFVRRCKLLVFHFLVQCQNYVEGLKTADCKNDLKFIVVLSKLSQLLCVLIALDVEIAQQTTLERSWSRFKHIVARKMQLEPNSAKQQEFALLLSLVDDINNELIPAHIFQSLLFELEKNCQLKIDLNIYFKAYLRKQIQDVEVDSEKSIANLLSLYVLSNRVLRLNDKKINRSLIDLVKKTSIAILFDEILLNPEDFLNKHIDSKPISNSKSKISSYLDSVVSNLPENVKSISFSTYRWIININMCSQDEYIQTTGSKLIKYSFEGTQLIKKIKCLCTLVIRLHNHLNRPMSRSTAMSLMKLIELLKGIEFEFNLIHCCVVKACPHVIQKTQVTIIDYLSKIKKDLSRSKYKSCESISVVENLIMSNYSKDKILIAELALTLSSPDLCSQPKIFNCLQQLTQISTLIRESECNSICAFEFIKNDLLPLYFKSVLGSIDDVSRLKYGLGSGLDCGFCENELGCGTIDRLHGGVLKPLFQDVETNLRVVVHEQDPLTLSGDRNYKGLLNCPVINVNNRLIFVKYEIERYLDSSFYDLTTVALHDWGTYRLMRSIGEFNFGLEFTEDLLPSQEILSGLDVLEILRNISLFVTKYLYNLNTQVFIESSSPNKHVNTIGIHQIANSIWTHGLGIMNTATNIIYQFLIRKMEVFSQFLFDDNIKSRLREKTGEYSYERGEKLFKSITRLGSTKNGLSYLEEYRLLITHIGNALGFVRILRAGGYHRSLQEATLLPNLTKTLITFEKSETYSKITNSILDNLSEDTEYLQLLTAVFSHVFASTSTSSHLKLFYITIPPLTLSYTQHIIEAKERVDKRSRDGYFTDDGFAMGLAYLLQVLNQNDPFDALQWFRVVQHHYSTQQAALLADAKQNHTINLSLRRLSRYKQEFELLQFTLDSARVFFQPRSSD